MQGIYRELATNKELVVSDLDQPLFTSYWGNDKKLLADGVMRVSIAQYAPRFAAGGWKAYKALAPTKEMLEMVKETGDHTVFFKMYAALLSKLDPVKVYKDLIEYARGHNMAIMCYETLDKPCHRHAASKWLEEGNGIKIFEYPLK